MKTPLYEKHVEAGAKMGPFGGWDMAIQYEGILAEHNHTRSNCSLFDICHMGEFEVKGPTAADDLDRLLTQSVASLEIGQCRYGYLLRDDGGVLDDLTCYCLSEETYYLVVNAGTCAGDAEWMRNHLSNNTTFTDLSMQTAKLDLQGPTSRACMEAALKTNLPDLKYFRAVETAFDGMPCILSRTGYTGEWGYELYFPWNEAPRLWDLFLAVDNIQPGGLGARDTLRLEMGYPLYGHELSIERTPIPASRGLFIGKEKEFIGHSAVDRDRTEGALRYLVGLRLETKRAARAHDHVFCDGNVIGEVTSGSLAPSLGVAVAMAYVDPEFCEVGRALQIEVRGKQLQAEVVDLPFYREGTARKKIG